MIKVNNFYYPRQLTSEVTHVRMSVNEMSYCGCCIGIQLVRFGLLTGMGCYRRYQ